ncbi:DUF4158 domain-containing protein [Nocardia spumae]|uniref:DUF4158 domain-containing protein n=1 Tax=Nocardia spumae TaxID=2887190 RepID=UPI002106032C|nr:DUF4158 domain-containing protein [Nocardia spumae]
MRELDQDELIDRWTLLGKEPDLVATKRGAATLGFGLMLRFYTERGRFRRGCAEIPDAAVDDVARQVGVERTEIAFYDFTGRTSKAHRTQIRESLGYRECSVSDAEEIVGWLVEHVPRREPSGERVREHLLARLREVKVEPPTAGRIERMVRSALHRGEELLFTQVNVRLPEPVRARLLALIAPVGGGEETLDGDAEDGPAVLAAIRSDPGDVSLNTMLTEIAKLDAVCAVGELDHLLRQDLRNRVQPARRTGNECAVPADLPGRPGLCQRPDDPGYGEVKLNMNSRLTLADS